MSKLVYLSDMDELVIPQNVAPQQEAADSMEDLPQTILLIRLGTNNFTKGGERGSFDANEEDLAKILEDFKTRGKDLTVDYEHNSLDKSSGSSGDSPAAGWIKELQMVPGKGLYGKVSSWTPKAADRLRNKEIRYTSPVLHFDDNDRPDQVHSVAITNKPSFHNPEALMAANDDPSAKQMMAKQYQDAIVEIDKGARELNDLMLETLRQYDDFCKGDESLIKSMRSFSDSVIGRQYRSFADMQVEIFDKRDSMTGPQMLAWLDSKSKEALSDVERNAVMAEMDRLNAFKSQFPELWDAGFTSGNERTVEMLKKRNEMGGYGAVADQATIPMMALSDMAKCLNIKSFTDTKAMTVATSALKVFRDDADRFFKSHNVKSFSDLSKKMEDMQIQFNDEIKKLKAGAEKESARIKVQKLLDDDRILEVQRTTMENLAMSSPKAFSDLVETLPVMRGLSDDILKGLAVGTTDPKTITVNDPELERKARMMGFNSFSDIKMQH